MHLCQSTLVSCLPGQENQGGVGILRLPPCIVCNLNHGDISTRDNGIDNDNNLSEGRKTLRVIHVGMGLRLCPPAPTTGGLWMQALVDHCATAGPLPQRGSRRCHRCCPQSHLPSFVWLQHEQGGIWGGQYGLWGRMRPTMTRAVGNKVGEG